MRKRATVSLWDSSSLEEDHVNPMTADAAVDVAIVGGGYTGLSTALHCAEKGLNARVIEAEHIGFGGSGRNVGLVNAGVWQAPAKVRAHLGETYGPRFVRYFGDAPRRVFDLIERHQIRCAPTRSGTIHAAHSPAGMADLRKRYEVWTELGAPVRLLTKAEAAEKIGSARFFGGLMDARAGTIEPMGYCRGLARAAHAAGATITTGARARQLSKTDDGWTVRTDHGHVTAKTVILATNAYTDALWPGLSRVFTKIHYFQLATEPLGDRVARILPERQGLWDTGRIMFSLRRDALDRLLIGSMGTVLGTASQGLSQRWAQKQLDRLFPDLGTVRFQDAWHGQIAMTSDRLPRICALDDSLYTCIGYNGRGITTGTVFGAAMADLLTGTDPSDLPLPISAMQMQTTAPLLSRVYQTAFTANQLLRSL